MYEDDDDFYAEFDRRVARPQAKSVSKTSNSKPQGATKTNSTKKMNENVKIATESRAKRMPSASTNETGVKPSKPEAGHVTRKGDDLSSSAIQTSTSIENVNASIDHFLNFPSAPKPVKHASDPLPQSKKRTLSEMRENSLPEMSARAASSNSLFASTKQEILPREGLFINEDGEGASKKRKANTITRSPSPMEDISMFPEESPIPKPKKAPALPKPKSAAVSRPIRRQPATHKLLPGKPSTSTRAPVPDEVEDISMFPAGDTPKKRMDAPVKPSDSNVTTPGAPMANPPDKKARVRPVASRPSSTLNIVRPVVRGNNRPMQTSVKDYVRSVQGNPAGPVNFLKGKVIFHVGQDGRYISTSTKSRVDLLIKYGATVQVDFDPDTATHVVVDSEAGPIQVAKTLGITDIMQIPDHIPTVKWSWVSVSATSAQVKKRAKSGENADFEDLLPQVFDHARFKERFEAGDQKFLEQRARLKAKEALRRASSSRVTLTSVHDSDEEDSREVDLADLPPPPPAISALPPVPGPLPSPPQSPGRLHRRKTADKPTDVLEEFLQQAREEVARGYETDETDDVGPLPKKKKFTPGGWQCDAKPVREAIEGPNQYIIDKLIELRNIHDTKGGADNHFRVQAYTKVIPQLKALTKRITCREDIEGLPNIGNRTIQKVMEIVRTGDLRKIKHEHTEEVNCSILFQGIYGVGKKTATDWYNAGCRTLEDIHARKGGITLNSAQKIGLKFYDDINTRMPRDEAEEIYDLVKEIAHKIDPKLSVDIMGSFRRGKPDCGDIDILITRPTNDGKTHAGIMEPLLDMLHSAMVLTEDLSLPEDMGDLECTYRGLCRLPDERDSLRRRIDILSVPWQSRGAALIYYTGDDIFNRSMRLKANKMGYSLNQRGLYAGVIRDPKNPTVKLSKGTIVASETEEQIFKILGVPWQEPHERIRRDSEFIPKSYCSRLADP